jgi:hypothetical protein
MHPASGYSKGSSCDRTASASIDPLRRRSLSGGITRESVIAILCYAMATSALSGVTSSTASAEAASAWTGVTCSTVSTGKTSSILDGRGLFQQRSLSRVVRHRRGLLQHFGLNRVGKQRRLPLDGLGRNDLFGGRFGLLDGLVRNDLILRVVRSRGLRQLTFEYCVPLTRLPED